MGNLDGLQNLPPVALFLLILWSLFWKGLALWRSAQAGQRNWFLVILVLNTLGILEIVYLFFFAKKRLSLKQITPFKSLQ